MTSWTGIITFPRSIPDCVSQGVSVRQSVWPTGIQTPVCMTPEVSTPQSVWPQEVYTPVCMYPGVSTSWSLWPEECWHPRLCGPRTAHRTACVTPGLSISSLSDPRVSKLHSVWLMQVHIPVRVTPKHAFSQSVWLLEHPDSCLCAPRSVHTHFTQQRRNE